jgi:hypothetical protein
LDIPSCSFIYFNVQDLGEAAERLKRRKWPEDGEDFLMRSFITVRFTKYY